jgi:3-hydroxyacyl-CoA dehydrogenase/enoyl-CoA hydratase/3-hydroxybutyryl-CoA epimerase
VSPFFRLEIEAQGLATLTFDSPGRSANVFTREALRELASRIEELREDSSINGLVLLSAKPKIFIAGADLDAIADVFEGSEALEGARIGQRLFGAWSALPFPTVAAVRGACLGGGTELALASDFILLSDRQDIRIGLPEIRLGIVPAWGGCTRLPRRIGLAAAVDVILGGKMLRPRKAFDLGLADRLLPDASFLREVRRFAENELARPARKGRRVDLKELLLENNPFSRRVLFDQARKRVLGRTRGHYPAPLRAVEVIRVGVEQGEGAGLDAEARASAELAPTAICKNLVRLFRLTEEAKKRSSPDGAEPRQVRSAAVLGAGVMGGGIAQIVADKADLPVRLKDLGVQPLAAGMRHAGDLFAKQVRRRWLSSSEASRKMGLIRPSLDYSGFGATDLLIEAVVENLEIKQRVFAEVAEKVPRGTILATNTSSLTVDSIAQSLPNPGQLVGMHFFNPVDKMPLVEVVVGERTSPEAVSTATAFARRIGKTPVVVQDGPGFLVNRLLAFSLAEAMWLLDEGHSIADLDRAATAWGMPMGPIALADEVGIDVAVEVAHVLEKAFPNRLGFPPWMDRLPEDSRLGAKARRGFYSYRNGQRTEPDRAVYSLLGLRPTGINPDPSRTVDRLLLPMVNEAARCLDERIVRDARQLDLAMILGTGFPPFRGGLCRWADEQGVVDLRIGMERWAAKLGDRFRPSAAFERVVEARGFYRLFG